MIPAGLRVVPWIGKRGPWMLAHFAEVPPVDAGRVNDLCVVGDGYRLYALTDSGWGEL